MKIFPQFLTECFIVKATQNQHQRVKFSSGGRPNHLLLLSENVSETVESSKKVKRKRDEIQKRRVFFQINFSTGPEKRTENKKLAQIVIKGFSQMFFFVDRKNFSFGRKKYFLDLSLKNKMLRKFEFYKFYVTLEITAVRRFQD